MTDQPDLKPCPFCGGKPHLYVRNGNENAGYADVCTISCPCGVSLSSRDDLDQSGWTFTLTQGLEGKRAKEKTLTAWNTRPAPAGPVNLVSIGSIIEDVYSEYNQEGGEFISDGALEEMERRILSTLKENQS